MTKRDIDTPALILDLDVVEENIRVMSEYFAARPQKLRPHFKTPKTPEIARRQLAAWIEAGLDTPIVLPVGEADPVEQLKLIATELLPSLVARP